MHKAALSTLKTLQVLLSFFAAIFSLAISGYLVKQAYIQTEGNYLEPFSGRPYIYNFWESFITGALFVTISYIFLYKMARKTLITATMFFIFNALYSTNIIGDIFYLNYEMIIGGITAIGLYEAVKRKCF